MTSRETTCIAAGQGLSDDTRFENLKIETAAAAFSFFDTGFSSLWRMMAVRPPRSWPVANIP
jgi:hypothetical protein